MLNGAIRRWIATGSLAGCFGLIYALAQDHAPTAEAASGPAAALAPVASPNIGPRPQDEPPLPIGAYNAVVQTLTMSEPEGLANYLGQLNEQKPYAVESTGLIKEILAAEIARRGPVANELRRRWATRSVLEGDGAAEQLTRAAEVVQPVLDSLTAEQVGEILHESFASLTGLTEPPPEVLNAEIRSRNAEAANIQSLQAATLLRVPTPEMPSFNWTNPGFVFPDRGIVSSPNNQLGCGCCWAFATVGAYEAAYALKHRTMIGASEQYLLNNTIQVNPAPAGQSWSCGGGWWAFDMFWDEKVNHAGVPRRIAYVPQAPHYLARQEPPRGSNDRPFKIAKWAYVSSIADIPSDADLKQALCEHGPLVVSIFAFEAWLGNRGSVLGDFTNNLDLSKKVNHAVVLIGWNDNAGGGAWIIKNSWGTNCGIVANGATTGFMYVKYGHNNIGYSAAYVDPL